MSSESSPPSNLDDNGAPTPSITGESVASGLVIMDDDDGDDEDDETTVATNLNDVSMDESMAINDGDEQDAHGTGDAEDEDAVENSQSINIDDDDGGSDVEEEVQSDSDYEEESIHEDDDDDDEEEVIEELEDDDCTYEEVLVDEASAPGDGGSVVIVEQVVEETPAGDVVVLDEHVVDADPNIAANDDGVPAVEEQVLADVPTFVAGAADKPITYEFTEQVETDDQAAPVDIMQTVEEGGQLFENENDYESPSASLLETTNEIQTDEEPSRDATTEEDNAISTQQEYTERTAPETDETVPIVSTISVNDQETLLRDAAQDDVGSDGAEHLNDETRNDVADEKPSLFDTITAPLVAAAIQMFPESMTGDHDEAATNADQQMMSDNDLLNAVATSGAVGGGEINPLSNAISLEPELTTADVTLESSTDEYSQPSVAENFGNEQPSEHQVSDEADANNSLQNDEQDTGTKERSAESAGAPVTEQATDYPLADQQPPENDDDPLQKAAALAAAAIRSPVNRSEPVNTLMDNEPEQHHLTTAVSDESSFVDAKQELDDEASDNLFRDEPVSGATSYHEGSHAPGNAPDQAAAGAPGAFMPTHGGANFGSVDKNYEDFERHKENDDSNAAPFLVPAAAAAAVGSNAFDDEIPPEPLATDPFGVETEFMEASEIGEPEAQQNSAQNFENNPELNGEEHLLQDDDANFDDQVYEDHDEETVEEEATERDSENDLVDENQSVEMAAAVGNKEQRNEFQESDEDLERGREESFGESTDKERRKRPYLVDILLVLGIVLVICVLAIALPFVLRRNRDDTQPQQPITNPPTQFPTTAPTMTKVPFTLVGGPFNPQVATAGFGYAASLDNDVAVIGAPGQSDEAGSVTTYLDTVQNEVVTGSQAGQLFGYSVDGKDDFMVVGAPGTFAEGSDFAAVGAAVFYELDRGSNNWSQLGSIIRGGTDIDSFSEMFGASVATSGQDLVVAVGAPKRKSGSGGVYSFRYQPVGSSGESDWVNMTATPLIVEDSPEGGQFGTAVAITSDGSRIAAGAPEWGGGRGYVTVYEWDETTAEWSPAFETSGETPGGKYGSSVAFLGVDTFAVGEPGAISGKGRVKVYQKLQGQNTFEQLGGAIEGSADGDAFGRTGTISGKADENGDVALLVASAEGTVDRFDYDGTDWIKPYTTVSDLGGAVTSVAMGGLGDNFTVGIASKNTASFYSTSSVGPSVPSDEPVMSPTMAPSLSTTSPVASSTPTLMPSAYTTDAQWELVAYFTGESRLGSSVAIASNTMASGDRTSASVATYRLTDDTWSPAGNVTVSDVDSGFGTSIAFSEGASMMIVGAPRTFAVGSTAVTTGAMYVYTTASGNWVQAEELRGAEGIYSAAENMGASVAVDSGGTILISGAPFNGEDGVTNRGRVYSFLSQGDSFTAVDDSTLLGTSSSDYFGSAVAISDDASTLIVGAPGGESGKGYVAVYSFDGSSWGSPVSTLIGSTSGELLGTSVAVLAADGSVFAAGAANYNGVGAVRVFERQGDGSFAQLGDAIEGATNAAVGGVDTISGSVDNGVPTLLVASSDGVISTYKFMSDAWVEELDSILTGLQGSPALRGSTALGSFVAGNANELVVYSLGQ
ncbi:hypothetical protein MPSEU_000019500 [Mayamaea pseudoterrestris]|nr:hypothetical protein MPSEU_000019500 [Mayamaea pseudoterrestris]